jgi:hypothetical protein
VTYTGNARCYKKSFTIVFQLLLCGERYANIYIYRRTNYFQHLEQWIVCTPYIVNVFVIPATQQHSEYHRKALFETYCILVRDKHWIIRAGFWFSHRKPGCKDIRFWSANFGGTKLKRNYIWCYENKKVEYLWPRLRTVGLHLHSPIPLQCLGP